MSEIQLTEKELRPERCLLSVPATTERFFPKAAAGNADTIMLDLEDAVATVRRALPRLKFAAHRV